MAKKLLIFIFLVGLFALLPVSPTFAAGPLPLAGEDCGIYTNPPPKNKCCYFDKTSKIEPIRPNLGLVDYVIGPIMDWIKKDLLEKVLGPTVGDLYNSYNDAALPCSDGTPSTPGHPEDPNCICIKKADEPLAALIPMCKNIESDAEKSECVKCLSGGPTPAAAAAVNPTGAPVGIWTGVGCVKSNVESFIQDTLLRWGVGLAGGISLLCIMYAAFMMQTSGGNAEKVKKAQQFLTACISGLMLIIFSVFILKLIGVDILRIPGLH